LLGFFLRLVGGFAWTVYLVLLSDQEKKEGGLRGVWGTGVASQPRGTVPVDRSGTSLL